MLHTPGAPSCWITGKISRRQQTSIHHRLHCCLLSREIGSRFLPAGKKILTKGRICECGGAVGLAGAPWIAVAAATALLFPAVAPPSLKNYSRKAVAVVSAPKCLHCLMGFPRVRMVRNASAVHAGSKPTRTNRPAIAKSVGVSRG
jgi:hypothetical protein